MKKSERKILEKKIIEVVNILIEKYESRPAKKLQKIVNEAAKGISKKIYKGTKIKAVAGNKKTKPVAVLKVPVKKSARNK